MQLVLWRRPIVLAAGASVVALALYTATLAPGLIAIEDTPKFQFVGRILGTAHPPGYPFYVVASHIFGLLPVGNLAWRINLFSAVCAALTVFFCQLSIVELGVAPLIAATAGLGLATGAGFWFAATIAEVYALHGCLFAGMTFSLLRWRRTQRTAWFFAAIVFFSIGLGHHTSIVTVGPAVALFAIVVAPRFALSLRTIGGILACFALGFSQYLFVLVRTRQGAWGESPASNLSELFDVVRGARWASYVAPLSFDAIASSLPRVLSTLANEASIPMIVVALIGAAVLARRDRPSLVLILGSMLGAVGFATFFSGQTEGFLQPAFVLVWLLVAVGVSALVSMSLRFVANSYKGVRPRGLTPFPPAEAGVEGTPQQRAVSGWSGRHPLRWGLTPGSDPIAGTLIAGFVVWHVSTNLQTRDLSHRRFEMRYFDALTDQLPSHSGLMAEDFLVDRMVLYEKFSRPTFDDRDIAAHVEAVPVRVREFGTRGYGLFAFAKSAAALRGEGFDFEYARWPLEYGSLRQFLIDQPRGSVVALAVPAMQLGTALSQDAIPLDAVGGRIPLPSWSNLTAIGVVGRSRGALQTEAHQERTTVFAGRGVTIGETRTASPTDVLVEAADDKASIRIGAREIIRSRQPVVAVWSPDGALVAAFALNADGRVPMPASALSVHRLRAVHEWTPIDSRPTDMTTEAASGHVMIRQSDAQPPTIVYAARRTRPLVPRLFDVPPSFGTLAVRAFTGNSRDLLEAIARDGAPVPADLTSMTHVYRIQLPSSPGAFHVSFGGIPDAAVAWQERASGSSAAAFYTIDLNGTLEPIDARTDRLHAARDHHQFLLGAGWSPISTDETGGFSLMTGAEAEILLPCDAHACRSVELQMWAPADSGAVHIAVNGEVLEEQSLHREWNIYRWTVPDAALRNGVNSLVVAAGQPVRLADVYVTTGRTP